MLVIFLDFDGVLNRGFGKGDPVLVGRLNKITERTGAKIVVHSSWRWGRSVDTLREILKDWGVKGEVADACPSAVHHKTPGGIWVSTGDYASFKGSIESDDERCIAIQRWLDENPGKAKKYVIFDDCPKLGHFVGKPEFLQTVINEGLQDHHVDAAIKILKGVTW